MIGARLIWACACVLAHRYAVDHMFHSERGVTATTVLKLCTEEEVGAEGLPSVNWPSDHLSLYAEFELEPDTWSVQNPTSESSRTFPPSAPLLSPGLATAADVSFF